MRRPLGLDPLAVDELDLPDVGKVRAGFIPFGQWDAIQARYMRAYHDAHARNKAAVVSYDLADELTEEQRRNVAQGFLLRMDPAFRVELAEINRDLVRWGCRGVEGFQLTTEKVQFFGRDYAVLTHHSLDVLELARIVDAVAGLLFAHWSLTPAEKKSSTTPASEAGTATSAATTPPSAGATAANATTPPSKAGGP